MKKCLAVLTGIMALVLFAPMANASFIECGSIGSVVGTTGFTGGTASLNASVNGAGLASLTCSGITVPAGFTLYQVDFLLESDAQHPQDASSAINYTWNATSGYTMSSPPEVLNLTSQAGTSFDTCSGVSGPGIGACPIILSATGLNIGGGGSYNAVTFTVSAAAVGADGVAPTGSDSATLYVQYDESSGVPEPATLSLIGGALLGLGVFGRKKLFRP